MEISVVDMVYLMSVSTNTSEQAALLGKYLPSELTSDADSSNFKARVVTLPAGRHFKFLTMFRYHPIISNLLEIIQPLVICQNEQ